jgi:hypothetical protein
MELEPESLDDHTTAAISGWNGGPVHPAGLYHDCADLNGERRRAHLEGFSAT